MRFGQEPVGDLKKQWKRARLKVQREAAKERAEEKKTEEKPRRGRTSKQEGEVLTVRVKSTTVAKGDTCRKCGVLGHWAKECLKDKPGSICRRCGAAGHLARHCSLPVLV